MGEFYNDQWRLLNNENKDKSSNYSMSFDSSSSQYVDISGGSIDLGTNSTISLWVNLTGSYGYALLGENSYVSDYLLYIDSNKIYFRVGSGYLEWSNSSDITSGNWHNILITRNNSNVAELFIDGQSKGTESTWAGTNPGTTTTKFDRIGARHGTLNSTQGKIDHISVFDYVLSSSQISDLYGNSTNGVGNPMSLSTKPVAYYKLGEKAAFNGSEYLVTNSASEVFSPYALEFDGTNDYIDSSFSGNVYACSLWFKPSSVINAGDALQYLISFGGNWDGVILGEMTGQLSNELILITDTSITGRSAYTASGGSISAEWHHLCLNWSGSVYEIWLDGANVQNATTGTPTLINASAIQIGRRSTSSYYNFDGSLSNVSIWNATLTSSQILELYNSGKPSDLNTHSAASNLVGWWQLGANSSFNSQWTVLDEVGTSNGTSYGMAENDLVNGPETTANGLSSGMGSGNNVIGEAPYSTANALSIDMGVDARTDDTPS